MTTYMDTKKWLGVTTRHEHEDALNYLRCLKAAN